MAQALDKMTDRFAEALQETERRGDPGPVTALFAQDAEASNLVRSARGRDQIQQFWAEYLDLFDDVTSEFTRVVQGDGAAALEWVSRGHLRNGRRVEYRGVSVIEVADDAIVRFRTYYDTAPFMNPPTSA